MPKCHIPGFYIIQTPSDGHCLLHSIIGSWGYQVTDHNVPSIDDIKCKIFTESTNYVDKYSAFIPDLSREGYFKQLRDYILHKHYNSTFGDIVPTIITNILAISIKIYNFHDDGSRYDVVVINPDTSEPKFQLSIHRIMDHFSSLKPYQRANNSHVNHRLQSWPMAPNLPTSTDYGVNHRQQSRPVISHPSRVSYSTHNHATDQLNTRSSHYHRCTPVSHGVHRQQPRPMNTHLKTSMSNATADQHKQLYSGNPASSPRLPHRLNPDHISVDNVDSHRQQSRPMVNHHGCPDNLQRSNQNRPASSDSGDIHRQQSRPVETHPSQMSTDRISYTSDQLRALRPAVSSINRDVRKNIFRSGIWKPKNNSSHYSPPSSYYTNVCHTLHYFITQSPYYTTVCHTLHYFVPQSSYYTTVCHTLHYFVT